MVASLSQYTVDIAPNIMEVYVLENMDVICTAQIMHEIQKVKGQKQPTKLKKYQIILHPDT